MPFINYEDRLHQSLEFLASTVPAFEILLNDAKEGKLQDIKKSGEAAIKKVEENIDAIHSTGFYIPHGTVIHQNLLSIAYVASLKKLHLHEAKPHYSRFVDGLIEGNYDKMRTGYGILHHILEWDAFEKEHEGRDRLLNLTRNFSLSQARLSNQGQPTAYGRDNYCKMAINAAEYCGAKDPINEIADIFTAKNNKK